MNSTQDFSFKSLNFTVVPRKCQNGHRQITIMWTRDGHHNPNTMWTLNHFEPLIPIPATISTVPSYAAIMKSQPPPSKPNISQQYNTYFQLYRKDRTDPFFGQSELVDSTNRNDFECKAADISTKYPSFRDYFHTKLKDRLYQYMFLPRFQLQHESLWTNNNCESVNHMFKRTIDWKPQRLPELIRTLHSLVKLQYADLKRSLFGQANFKLHDNFLKHLLTHQCWHAKSEEQKERLYTRQMKDCGRKSQQNTDTVTATCHDFTVPVPQRLAKKPHQNKRPRVCRSQRRF